mmetsp:Transcript_24071/g.71966  ORF Transcript_24071/g.71966 Transcript_24071/m.71966 type:complete len:319 (-) Transcript_24071:74-1030(-)
MWFEFFTSGAFWGSVVRSYVINVAFGLSVNLLLNGHKTTIPFLDDFQGDMAVAFASSAFFCGLFTPLFSSCFIRRKVQSGLIRPPDATLVARSWFACLLRQGGITRSLLLAVWDLLIFGTATLILGGLARSLMRPDPCELEVWAFLVLLIVWCVPVQVQTSLLNFVAVAHCSRRPADATPLAPRALVDMEGSPPLGDTSPNEMYLMEAVKMSPSEIAEFPAFFSKCNPDVQERYKDLCKENNTLDEYMANPLVFILANNPQCCAHIARDYVDNRSSPSASTNDQTPDTRTNGSQTPSLSASSRSVASERNALDFAAAA